MNEAECVLAIARPMSASQPFVTSRRRFSTRAAAASRYRPAVPPRAANFTRFALAAR